MSWKGLRKKGTEILTSVEWNIAVDALDELYGRLTTGQEDITVRDIYARTGSFSEQVFVQGKPVVKHDDPIQIYKFYDIAVAQITRAIDESRVTGISDSIREYTERAATTLERHQPKLDLIAEYTREVRDVTVKLRIDEYGDIGVVIAEPLDVYGRVAVSAPNELLEEFKSISAHGYIPAEYNTAGFEVVLEKGGRPNVNIYFSLGGAGELFIEISRNGVNWRTLHYYSFTAAISDVIVDTGIAYHYIRARTPTTGIDVEFEIVASR